MTSLCRLFGLVGVSLILVSCALGGGTIGTGVAGLSDNQDSSTSRSVLKFRVKGLVKSCGTPVSGGKLTALTAEGEEVAAIGTDGRFDLLVNKMPGEPVFFEIELSRQTYRLETELSPAGAGVVNLNFFISRTGDVTAERIPIREER